MKDDGQWLSAHPGSGTSGDAQRVLVCRRLRVAGQPGKAAQRQVAACAAEICPLEKETSSRVQAAADLENVTAAFELGVRRRHTAALFWLVPTC